MPTGPLDAMYRAVLQFEDPHEEFERVIRRVFEAVLKPGDTAVDVGAHVGKHTIPMALAVGRAGRVVAIEALPWAAEQLTDRLVVAELSARVEVLTAAAGAESAYHVRFDEVVGHPGWSALHVRAEATEVIEHRVPVITIDDAVGDQPVRGIKVDIEGAELFALQGAAATIERCRPVIHAEVVPAAIAEHGWEPGALFALFESAGYRVFDLLGNELTEGRAWSELLSSPGPLDHFDHFDVIAVHEADDVRGVRRILASSFDDERFDLAGHGVVELIPHVDVDLDDVPRLPTSTSEGVAMIPRRHLDGPSRVAGSVWPRGNSISAPTSLVFTDRRVYLANFNTATLDDLAATQSLDASTGAGRLDLPSGRELAISFSGMPTEPRPDHRTFLEVELGPGLPTGLVRWHRNGQLECVWVHRGRVISIDGAETAAISSPTVRLRRDHRIVTLRVTDAGSRANAAIRILDGEIEPTVTIGHRSNWPAPEPLSQSFGVRAMVRTVRPAAEPIPAPSPSTSVRSRVRTTVASIPGARRAARAVRKAMA